MCRFSLSCVSRPTTLALLLALASAGQAQTEIVPDEPATQTPETDSLNNTAAGQEQQQTDPVDASRKDWLTADSYYDAISKVLRDERFGFQAMMPFKPTSQDVRLRSKFGAIAVRRHALNLGEVSLMVIHSDYPEKFFTEQQLDPIDRPMELLEFTALSSVAGRQGAKLLHRKEIRLGQRVGLEQAVVFPAESSAEGTADTAGVAFQRSFVRKRGLDVVFVQCSQTAYERQGDSTKQAMIEFLDSFQYLEERE